MNTANGHFTEGRDPDRAMEFYVFMVVFWPVALVLGLIDFAVIREYDLRLPTLAIGLLAGWLAVKRYRKRAGEEGGLT